MKKKRIAAFLLMLLSVITSVFIYIKIHSDSTKFVGIELSASGIKCCVFKVNKEGKYKVDTMFSKDPGTLHKSIGSTRIGDENIDILVETTKGVLNSLDLSNIPDDNIYVVIGSFFFQAQDIDKLVSKLAIEFKGYQVQSINTVEEASANFKTVSEQQGFPFDANGILILDIGSGQTSLSTSDTGIPFSRTIALGTKVTSNSILSGDSVALRNINQSGIDDIIRAINDVVGSNVDFNRKDRIVITGGIAFRICCENDLKGQLPNLTPQIVSKFRRDVILNTQLSCDFPAYSNKQLLCGATILESFQHRLGLRKSYYDFDRHTWIPGFVINDILEKK